VCAARAPPSRRAAHPRARIARGVATQGEGCAAGKRGDKAGHKQLVGESLAYARAAVEVDANNFAGAAAAEPTDRARSLASHSQFDRGPTHCEARRADQAPSARPALTRASTRARALLRARRRPAHKWLGIAISARASLDGIKATIERSLDVRRAFERAMALDGRDATSAHLLGLWHFEVASVGWLAKRTAAALFAQPPESSYGAALELLLAAEALQPGFYKKNRLLIGKTQACPRPRTRPAPRAPRRTPRKACRAYGHARSRRAFPPLPRVRACVRVRSWRSATSARRAAGWTRRSSYRSQTLTTRPHTSRPPSSRAL
jgi:hypothetical protein